MRTVVAALIARDSKLLICQRSRDDSHPLRWEFPGGKVEPGETFAEALARELTEELGVTANIGNEIYRTQHRYGDFLEELLLIFFQANIGASAALHNAVFEHIEWAEPSSLAQYGFLAADKELVGLLASGAIRLDSR